MRIILFTGKGGVGKTTIAAATGLKSALEGKKTLIISTDPAHSLSDSFNIQLGPEPTLIAPNLYGQELDVYYSMRKYWGNLRELMVTLFRWQGLDSILAEELSAIPGMEEGAAFMWIEKYYSEKAFETIVIDSAPTGETLTLLTLPQVTQWWVTKTFPFQKFAIKTIGAGIRRTTGVPLDKGYEELEFMFKKLENIQKVFANPDITSIRIVTNPEKMVINESKRAYTYLQLYGYNIDAVIINRILPETSSSDFMYQYTQKQADYITEIVETFSPIPIFKLKHQGHEIFGVELLKSISQDIYGDHNPNDIFFKETTYKIKHTKGKYEIQLKLPHLNTQSFKLNKYGDEIVLELGNRRKNFYLPRFTNFMVIKSYSYANQWLSIMLEAPKD